MLPDREIHVVDSQGASMAEGILALHGGPSWRRTGGRPAEIAEVLETRAPDLRMYVALETLEYLKKGGRISGAQAAIGTLLSVKPIIAVEARRGRDGRQLADAVEVARALHRADLRAADRALAILHTMTPDVEAFRAEVDPPGRASTRRRRVDRPRRRRRSGRTSAPAASARRSCTRR